MSEKIPSGTHLIAIIEAETVKIMGERITNEGSYAVKVRFATGDNKHYHDEIFWTLLPDFKQLCEAIEVDLSKPICPELLGKRLWGVFDCNSEPMAYLKCENPLHHPSECELVNGPSVLESKIDFKKPKAKDFNGSKNSTYPIDEVGMWPEITPEQKEKLDLGKKIIAETMKKPLSSLNQKNKPDNGNFSIEEYKVDVDDNGVVNKITITNHGTGYEAPKDISDWDDL